jgi:hypothetical protein
MGPTLQNMIKSHSDMLLWNNYDSITDTIKRMHVHILVWTQFGVVAQTHTLELLVLQRKFVVWIHYMYST